MKKSIVLAIFLMVFTFQNGLKAQYGDRQFVADVFYGYSIFGSLMDVIYTGTEISYANSSFGPIGVRADYLVNDKFGIGLELNYRSKHIESEYISLYDNQNYSVLFDSKQLRAFGRFSYYAYNEDNINLYFGLGIGYANKKYEFVADEPNSSFDEDLFGIPLATRAFAGFRYFIIDNVGLNLELGVGGGSFVNGGISIGL